MTLDEYLTDRNETATAFAARIGLHTATVARLRRGELWPSRETVDLILTATDQMVTPNDFAGIGVSAETSETSATP